MSGDKPIRSWWKTAADNRFLVENQRADSTGNLENETLGNERATGKAPANGHNSLSNSLINDSHVISNITGTINGRIQIMPKLRRLSSDDKWSVGSLSIDAVQPQDSGYYVCSVQNEYGSADLTIRLIVQEPPYKPTEVQLLENGSRSARLSWKSPFNGNSEISKYWLFCHLQHFKGECASSASFGNHRRVFCGGFSMENIRWRVLGGKFS